jgi:opacity protein-like surface antigen
MKKTLLGAAIAVLSSSVVYAQDYQFEVSGIYVNGDNGTNDYDGFGLNAKLHLDKVDTSKGPLNEAAFLDKSSFADLTWVTAKADVSGADSVDSINVGGRFVTEKNIIIEAEYTDVEDDSAIKVGVGTYLNNNMDVVASYESYDSDADGGDNSTFSADLHGLHKLKGETSLAFDAGLAYIDNDGESAYGISGGADYYLNNAFSIGAGVALVTADDYDASTIDIRADYFVTPIARVGVGFSSEGQDAEGDSMNINGSVRF